MEQGFTIFALSDATGELAHAFAVAAANQFPEHEPRIVRGSKILQKEQIKKYVVKARECLGIIVFTFVKAEMRREILDLAKQHQVVAIDVMGPALDSLSNYFHKLPTNKPGLQYKQTQQYFKRIEALEFTVKHDNGLSLQDVGAADIILLGISRTSKTPLAIFLAYRGFCCANIPIIKDIPLPKEILSLDQQKIVGITMDANKLSEIRMTRMTKLGRSVDELYSDSSRIQEETDYAVHLYQQMNIPVIDTTSKAIEEVANEIITLLKL